MEEFVKKKYKFKTGDIVKITDGENYGKLGVITDITEWDILGLISIVYTIIGYKSGTVNYELQYDGECVPSMLYLEDLFEKY